MLDEQTYNYHRKIEKRTNSKTHNKEQLNAIVNILSNKIAEPSIGTPIFINYGIHRAVFDVPLRIRNKHDVFDELVAFENCLDPVTDFRTFFEWYRNQEDIENELITCIPGILYL